MGMRAGKAENLKETRCSKKMWEKSKACSDCRIQRGARLLAEVLLEP
jgi:hypothetical protein